MTARTPEHEAALDALEGMVRLEVAEADGLYCPDETEHNEALRALVHAGRMEWVGDHYARFVPKPKPLLSEEQVAGAQEAAFAQLGSMMTMDQASEVANAIGAALASLTQEEE